MDYWANVDAVEWFARRVFPDIRAQLPEVEFHIVGTRPTAAVVALASLPGITVTGSVPDVRPFLAHASLVVAPLRIARGIQNKVLEAMAMEKIAVVSPQAMAGIGARPGEELVVASGENEFASKILALLRNGSDPDMGGAARNRVLECYSWEKSLGRFDALLTGTRTVYAYEEIQQIAKLLPVPEK
jgi:glycosyltransferase involved in cell wall biosynthesis